MDQILTIFAIWLVAKLNTHKFLEFAYYHNFICIEYQYPENSPN